MPVFDAGDVDYMVVHFSLPELRYERHAAEVHESTAKAYGDNDLDYWGAYRDLVELSKEVRQSVMAPVLQRPLDHVPHLNAEEIKARTDIVSVIERHTALRKVGKRYTGLCPLHADKKSASLMVYAEQQSWYCFGCGKGGDVFAFLMAANNIDFKSALVLAERL